MTKRIPLAALLFLAACDRPAVDNAAITNIVDPQITEVADESGGEAVSAVDGWTGKWIGVEGLVLDIAPGASAEARALKIALLDGTNDYVGTVDGDTIMFVRDGKTETIRAGTGAETGLKYLAAKTNCLIIQSGEGFCR